MAACAMRFSLLDQAIGYGGGAVRQAAVESMLGSISQGLPGFVFWMLCMISRRHPCCNEARTIIEHSPDYQRVCAEMISLWQQVALYQGDPKI